MLPHCTPKSVTVLESSFTDALPDNGLDYHIHTSRNFSGEFPTRIKKLLLWVDLANMESESDYMQVDILTVSPVNAMEYISVLSRPITVSHQTASRELINISAHLADHSFNANDVIMVQRRADTQVEIPTLVTIELC